MLEALKKLSKHSNDSQQPINIEHLIVLLYIEQYGEVSIQDVVEGLSVNEDTVTQRLGRLSDKGTNKRKGLKLLKRKLVKDPYQRYLYSLSALGARYCAELKAG